jgi:hypothetical protein
MSRLDELREAQTRIEQRRTHKQTLAQRVKDGLGAYLGEPNAVSISTSWGVTAEFFVLNVQVSPEKRIDLHVNVEMVGGDCDVTFHTVPGEKSDPIRVSYESDESLGKLYEPMFLCLKESLALELAAQGRRKGNMPTGDHLPAHLRGSAPLSGDKPTGDKPTGSKPCGVK